MMQFYPNIFFFFFFFCLIPTTSYGQQIYWLHIANQGNFSDANGSITQFTGPVSFGNQAGNQLELNTLVQSMTYAQGTSGGPLVYAMANTSDRIDIFDLETNQIGQILNIPSPRYLTQVSPRKAYVSNLYANTVSIINLNNNTVAGTIPVGLNPEGIAVSNDRAFVANSGFGFDSTLTVIDIASDTVVDTLQLGCDNPRMVYTDGVGDVWAFCNGKVEYNSDFSEIVDQTNAAVVVIDGEEVQIRNRFDLNGQAGSSSGGQDAYLSTSRNQAFFIQDQMVLSFDTRSSTRGDTLFLDDLPPPGAVVATSETILVTHIPSFTESGFINQYWNDQIFRLDTGIAPSHIAFIEGQLVSNEEETLAIQSKILLPHYPNPVRSETTFHATLPTPGPAKLQVFDLLGRLVDTPYNSFTPAGELTIPWSTGNLAPGAYTYVLTAGESRHARQLIILP